MGDTNTNNSANNVDAVTALTNAATIRKLLRLPNEDGKTNFEIIQVRSIPELSNGHNCEVTIRVDLAFGHEGLPVPENERYSVRTETVRRIDLKEVAKLAGLEINDKQQYIGSVTDVESVGALLKAKLTEDDITIAQIKDVMWVRAKPESVGFVGMLTFAEAGEPGEKLPTSDPAVLTVNSDGTTITAITAGNATVTYTANGDTGVKFEQAIAVSVPVDPNKDASYESKVTFKSDFGTNTGEFHAGYVNVGDMVNLIIRPVDLVEPQAITLSVSNPAASIELDATHTLTPRTDLVVPMIINGTTTTDPISIYVKINDQPVGMSMGFYIKDPAVVPTTATFAAVPANIPAGESFGSSVTLDVGLNEYIVRDAVWTSTHPDDVTLTPFSITNPLSMNVQLGAGLEVGTVVKLTCVVDGITAVSNDITIIAP